MPGMSQIDYLAIGHFSRDITSFGEMTGGTVAYSGATAAVLGCRTAILSSYAPDFQPGMGDLDIAVEIVPAPETTTFKNIYQNGSRQQVLYGRASQLTVEDVPPAWTRASIVHLAPVAGEVDLAMAAQFTNSLLGLTPQGWLRSWADDGRVSPGHWQAARRVLPLAAAVVLSSEDLADEDWAVEFRKWARLLALTFSLAGDFVATFACLRQRWLRVIAARELVLHCAEAALGRVRRGLQCLAGRGVGAVPHRHHSRWHLRRPGRRRPVPQLTG